MNDGRSSNNGDPTPEDRTQDIPVSDPDPGNDATPPPPPGGDGGGGSNPNNQKVTLARLGMLYMEMNEVINNMTRTSSLIMKGVLLGSLIVSAFGLNKPSASIVRGVRHLLNKASRAIVGSQLGKGLEDALELVVAFVEHYGFHNCVKWGVESALCLERGDCENEYLNYIQVMKIETCGLEPHKLGIIQSNYSYCHLAFNCIPFMILLLGVILLYVFVKLFGENKTPPKPQPPPPTPGPVTSVKKPEPTGTKVISQNQLIAAYCPTCKKESTLSYPNPTPAVCPNCAPKGPSTDNPNRTPRRVPFANKTISSLAPCEDLQNHRLFTNMRIPVSNSSIYGGSYNALTNIPNQGTVASEIHRSILANFFGGGGSGNDGSGSVSGGDNNGSGDDNDNNDNRTECCDMTQEDLTFLRLTIQNSAKELLDLVSNQICLKCHDDLHAAGLCSCPCCGFDAFHPWTK